MGIVRCGLAALVIIIVMAGGFRAPPTAAPHGDPSEPRLDPAGQLSAPPSRMQAPTLRRGRSLTSDQPSIILVASADVGALERHALAFEASPITTDCSAPRRDPARSRAPPR